MTIWLGRFIGQDLSSGGIGNSFALADDWHSFRDRRAQMDARILDWADQVKPEWFAGEMTWYSGAMGREVTLPLSVLSVQMFNHQTHHRGQIHAMLTAAGARPGDTDVFFLPDLTDPPARSSHGAHEFVTGNMIFPWKSAGTSALCRTFKPEPGRMMQIKTRHAKQRQQRKQL